MAEEEMALVWLLLAVVLRSILGGLIRYQDVNTGPKAAET